MSSRNEELPLAVEIERTKERLHILDGLLSAMQDPRLLLDLLLEADDVVPARAALRERLGLDDLQARAVLDMQFRNATRLQLHKLQGGRDELAAHLRFLEDLDAGSPG